MLCSLHVFMKLPSLVPDHIGTKACPGRRSGIDGSCHQIHYYRVGGNPRKAWVAELRESITDLRTRQSRESKVLPPLPRWQAIEVRVTPAGPGLVSSQGHTGNPPHTTCRVPSREFPSLTPSFPRRRESRGGRSGANDSQTLLKTKRHLHASLCRQRTTRTIPMSIDGHHLKRGDPPPLPRWERIEVRVNPVALGLGPSQRAHSLYRVAGIRLR